jgi:hypothetical protein
MTRDNPVSVIVISVLLAAAIVMTLALMRHESAPTLAEHRAEKSDMVRRPVRVIPIDREPSLPAKEAEATQPPEIDQFHTWPGRAQAQAINPTPPVAPPVPAAPPPVHRDQNICDRTGGYKVETNNGRSWHCAYAHRN